MKGLSLQQPYASAIIDGPKRVENRSRRMGLRAGKWIWMHASQSFYFNAYDWVEVRVELQRLWSGRPVFRQDYPTGAILGAVLIGETYDTPRENAPTSPWEFGPVCTEIKAVVKLPEPVRCRGALGLWTPSEDALEACIDAVPRMDLEHLTPEQFESFMKAVGLPEYAVACPHCGSRRWGVESTEGCSGCGHGSEADDFMEADCG